MQTRYAFFIQLKALPTWLRLSRDRRRQVADACLGAAMGRCPSLRVRHFDAEAFCAPCTDLMLVETTEPREHYAFMEHLRDSALLTEPYFDVLAIIPTIEEGYRAFEHDVASQHMAIDA